MQCGPTVLNPGGDEWGVSEFNYPMRTLLSVQLVDVAPVLDPAYPDATAGARALNGAVQSLADWVQADVEEVRCRLNEGRAMEFFRKYRDADGWKPKSDQRLKPPKSRGDVLEYVQRGDVRHSSFAFRVFPGGDEWGVSEFNYPMRTLMSVQLVDVAPVLDPAYPDATAGARALNGAVQSLADWVQSDVEEVRMRLSEGRAMEYFKRYRDIDGWKPKTDQRLRPPKKPVLTGAQALLTLQANTEDPWADEE